MQCKVNEGGNNLRDKKQKERYGKCLNSIKERKINMINETKDT